MEIAKTLAEGEIGSTEILMCVEWEFAILHVASVDLDTPKELGGIRPALVKLWEGEIDYLCEKPYLAGQANTTRGVGRLRHAAILAENTRNMTVRGCSFTGIGGNGVQSVNNSVNFTVKDCIFKDVGMCGVTVGNPSYNWDVSHSVMVNCARPLFSQYTVHHAFTNHNHIHDIYFTKTPNMVSYEPSHAPYRDTLLYDLHFVEGGLDELIEAFPVAKEIKDAAGCTLLF